MVVVPSRSLVTAMVIRPVPVASTQKPAAPPRAARGGPEAAAGAAHLDDDRLEQEGQLVASLVESPHHDAHGLVRFERGGVGHHFERRRQRVGDEAQLLHRHAADEAGDGHVAPFHSPAAELRLGEVLPIDDHRRVRQVRKTLAVGRNAPRRLVAIGDLHRIAIGEHDERQRAADIALAAGPDGHRLQHDRLGRRALAGIGVGGEFRLAKHVHHAVMADTVARAEILVGIVVEGAPADAAGNPGIAIGGVQYLEVAADMLGLALLLVVALGGNMCPPNSVII